MDKGYGISAKINQSAVQSVGTVDSFERPPSTEHSILRAGNGNPRARVNVWELIFVPWLILVLILICYLQAGTHGYHAALLIIPTILLSLNTWFIVYHYNRANNPEVVLGILCLTASIISLTVGVFGVSGSLSEYRQISQGASYFNVLPSEPAAGKADATTLMFTNASRVDLTRAFGFTDILSTAGHTYCVAPILSGDLFQTRIEYWAAGVDCCEAHANFACHRAQSDRAHGALVWQASRYDEGFRKAVRGAEALYRLTTGPKFLLVKWTENPVGYRNALWNQTTMLFMVFGGVYLVISSMIGIALLPVIAGK